MAIQAERDQVVARAVYVILGPLLRPWLHPGVFSRPFSSPKLTGRGQHEAIALLRHVAPEFDFALRFDLRQFFLRFPHHLVLTALREHVGDAEGRALIRTILRSVAENPRQNKGLGQGTILSGLLANIGMTSFDRHFDPWQVLSQTQKVRSLLRHPQGMPLCPPAIRGRQKKDSLVAGMFFLRYVDDVLVFLEGDQARATAARDYVVDLLDSMGLTINESKSSLVTSNDFAFQGVAFSPPVRSGDPMVVRIAPGRIDVLVREVLHDAQLVVTAEDAERFRRSLESRLQYFADAGVDVMPVIGILRSHLSTLAV